MRLSAAASKKSFEHAKICIIGKVYHKGGDYKIVLLCGLLQL